MGLYGRAPLIPEMDLHPQRFAQVVRKAPVELRARALGAVHVAREAHHDLPGLRLADHADDLLDHTRPVSAVDDSGRADDGAGQVGDRDPGPGVAVVDCKCLHILPPFRLGRSFSTSYPFPGQKSTGKCPKNPEKNAFFSLTSGLRCGRMTSPVKKGAFFVRRFFSRGGERSSR